jgi:hypothetical protein
MQRKFVQFSCGEVPALPAEHSLTLNIDERIVTLLGPGHICAQSQFPRGAFRLLCLLLRAPYGADYAELLACLSCPETVFRRVVNASSHEQALAFLAPQTERWSKHLEYTARQGDAALEKELKMVRRAAKERCGANTVLQNNGFSLTVRALYRKGYLLDRAPDSRQPRPERRRG